MRQIIILTDEDLDALKNDKMVQVPSRHIDSTNGSIYLTTQKGYEIDLKEGVDTFEQAAKDMNKAIQAGRGCDTCKHCDKSICEEPCMGCEIRLGNNSWEAKD